MNLQLPFSLNGSVYVTTNPNDGLHIGTDADSALYTGIYLASLACEYETAVNRKDKRTIIAKLEEALEAVIRLSRGLGPGIISRMIIPIDGFEWDMFGYDKQKSLKADGNTWGDRIRKGKMFNSNLPRFDMSKYAYYADATRDQLTGLLFGFAVCNSIPLIKERFSNEIDTLWYGFSCIDDKLLDPEGGHHCSAYKLDPALKEIIGWIKSSYITNHFKVREYPENLCLSTFHYNTRFTRRFVFHLRLLQAATLSLFGIDTSAWAEKTFSYVKEDNNPQFKALLNIASHKQRSFNGEELANLAMARSRPYQKFFRWEKPPEEWDAKRPNNVGPGLDYFVPTELMAYAESLKS